MLRLEASLASRLSAIVNGFPDSTKTVYCLNTLAVEFTAKGTVECRFNDSPRQQLLLVFTESKARSLLAGGGKATVAIAIESVTATVIDLYVYWKPGFMLDLEAWRSAIGFDSTAWFQLESTIGGLELD